jgi:uncharacterized protein DUF4189
MTRTCLAFCCLVWTASVWAQTACPEGVAAGDARCGPSPIWHQFVSEPPPSGPRWQLTWGAIAGDRDTGDIGTSVGKFSKREAKREAIARCAVAGSKNCKLQLAYHNQCAVIAGPSENGEIVAGTTIFQGGPSVEIATQIALSACSEKRGGRSCLIDYSDCTEPVLVSD